MIQDHIDAQDAPKPLLHPFDPSVEQEYDILTRSWKNQLIQNMPVTTNTDYVRIAWIRLMDHYLDQHWLDSKQMLQCAQAWSSRDSLSMSEAVHTMSTLSLKSMQRSLDARQELLNTLGDPEIMMAFGVSPSSINNDRTKSESSMLSRSQHQRFSLEPHDEDEEHEIHAPLLARHTVSQIDELLDAYSEQPSEEKSQENEVWEDFTDIPLDKKDQVPNQNDIDIEEEDIISSRLTIGGKSTSDIVSQSDRPIILHHSSSMSDINTISSEKASYREKYRSHQSIHSIATLKEDDEQKDLDESSIYSAKSDGSSQLGNGSPWKSWFLGDQGALENDSVHRKLTTYGSGDFANEKVETDAPIEIYNNQNNTSNTYNNNNSSISAKPFLSYGHLISPQHDKYPFKMVRSESSISAFRPISNNLAPRCQPPRHRRNSSSTTMTDSGDQSMDQSLKATATINKSRSFPSKSALNATMSSSPPPLPNKERHFMLRSIVSKKASLSKLFGVKKSLSSASIS
ncbi:hypothetical protein K501DRAFT_269126 [Backusella circina FSU 941]|nr:hypothetical protein K501DRAFT_269126 [Backusella circina FSU 941]